MNRVFLDTGGSLDPRAAYTALKEGRTFASNGPLLGLEVGGVKPGGTAKAGANGARHFRVALRSPVAVDHLELVQNGRVVRAFTLSGDRRTFDGEGDLDIAADGWLVLRAWNDGADPLVLDIYPYATTSPVYLEGFGPRPDARADAEYFVRWLDRVIEAARSRSADFNDERERHDTFEYLERARAAYAERAQGRAQ